MAKFELSTTRIRDEFFFLIGRIRDELRIELPSSRAVSW